MPAIPADTGYFNPHSREGSDVFGLSFVVFEINFNPHSREGSDIALDVPLMSIVNFNPHSREGSDTNFLGVHKRILHFNPHSREGSDSVVDFITGIFDISIHTPAKGVTSRCQVVR